MNIQFPLRAVIYNPAAGIRMLSSLLLAEPRMYRFWDVDAVVIIYRRTLSHCRGRGKGNS